MLTRLACFLKKHVLRQTLYSEITKNASNIDLFVTYPGGLPRVHNQKRRADS